MFIYACCLVCLSILLFDSRPKSTQKFMANCPLRHSAFLVLPSFLSSQSNLKHATVIITQIVSEKKDPKGKW